MDSTSDNKQRDETNDLDGTKDVNTSVTSLQAKLFTPLPTLSTSYFANFLLKHSTEDETKFKTREPPKDWWINKEPPFDFQPPRWPTECQVLEERVYHIVDSPPTNELYYVPTGSECQPAPSGEECGKVVFQYTPLSAVNYFCRSSVGGNKFLLPSSHCPGDETLKFESRFESGNLAKAIMITPTYYELHLRSDLYTNRHMQWYYFRVSNVKKGNLYRFSITNCSKESSLYNEGMRPLMYSTKESTIHNIGWRRCGTNISYYCNENITSTLEPDHPMTYTLTFTIRFPHDNDEVYLAHSYPYTYSDLQDYLLEMSTHPVKSTFTSIRPLCKSLAGNNVQYVTITTPPAAGAPVKKKKAIVLTARVHPGETPSSWIMKGILDFLSSDTGPAKELRDKFIFKIVPMLNPDGVIVGNNRCSLSAKDLNRQYRTVIRDAYPSIWYTKLMVRRLLEECGVAMYCDIHAHSRKHNIFIYGCENRRGNERKLHEQVFPLMLHKNAADKFSFESCKFKVQKNKEGTGRVVMWMMGIANSYTLETSLAGSTLSHRAYTHFTIQDYEQMGKTFCQTLLDFYDEDPKKEKLRMKIVERLVKEGSNADEPMNITLSDYSSDNGDTSNSSDEVGRDYGEDIETPLVPPCSPIFLKRTKSKTSSGKVKYSMAKSPSVSRRPLPICKATLKLSLSDKESSVSCSSFSDSDTDKATKTKIIKRRKKKKYSRKKKSIGDRSDREIHHNRRTISVFDLLPADTLNNESLASVPRFKTSQALRHVEKKDDIHKQLAEVQAKLFTLKHKLWFGVGNGDTPIAWSKRTVDCQKKMSQKEMKKQSTKSKKSQKVEKKLTIKDPKDSDTKEKSTVNGPKPKAVCDFTQQKSQTEKSKLRKSKSLPDTSSLSLMTKQKSFNYEDDREKKKKKKLVKKVKSITNAKAFTTSKKTE
ncbi:unnamed protein product [Phyllotreta striolata]|uniref:Peptidase M14 domain-containing protein n=1 Tax=Phyllotreta striolata TaxID=444603 RepID=A0A9N9XNP0_PHYSR|nr:unnamed protein product [Phyllotreta striolata]